MRAEKAHDSFANTAIRGIDPNALIFVEAEVGGDHPHWQPNDPAGVVNAGHWYNVPTLLTKTFAPDSSVDFATDQPVHGKEAVQALDMYFNAMGANLLSCTRWVYRQSQP